MPRQDIFIPMSDGVRLAATLFVPETSGPWPAILEALPYRKDDLTAADRPEYIRLRDEGDYVVCRVDVRGTGSSEGVAEDEYPPQEQKDLVLVVEWLAAQDWCTGAVGMYGTSYGGFNSIQVAMERPPALKAIIPIYATDDRYADDVHYFGGARKALDLVDYPLYMVAMNALPPVPLLYGQGWREEWEQRVHRNEPWLIRWFAEQTFGPYWQHGSLRPNYDRIEAATMIVAGWADGYTNNSLRTMAGMRCPKRLLLGPWSHAAPDVSLPGPNIDLVPEMLRWWDRWLRGTDNGVDREPPIVVFVRRSTKPAATLLEVRGEWRYEEGWPLARGAEWALDLEKAVAPRRPGGGPDSLEVRGDVGKMAWISCAGHLPYGQPLDQRSDEAFSLVFDWPTLDEELEILGHPRLEVTVTSSAPVAYLSAKLCDVFPDGTSALVTRGLLNLTHRDSREDPEALQPGKAYRVSFELEVTSWVFEKEHRIRLDLAGADWPNAWPPPEPVTLAIETAGSILVLPVVEGPSPITDRPSLSPPKRRQERARPASDESAGVVWRLEEDVLARESRATVGSWSTTERVDDHPRVHERYDGVVAVSTEDPGMAWVEGQASFRIEWPQVTVESRSHHRIESDSRAYRLELELEVSENDQSRWRRHWSRTFPRNLQ